MDKLSFLEELEHRLNQLEEELNNHDKIQKRDFIMENMIHNFDEALERTSETDPALLEKRFRYMDY